MMYLTESKAQGWRAMASFKDGRAEALLLIAPSSTKIRANYLEAFKEVLDDEERDMVESISMQQWEGAPDAGRWKHKTSLKVPTDMAVEVKAEKMEPLNVKISDLFEEEMLAAA